MKEQRKIAVLQYLYHVALQYIGMSLDFLVAMTTHMIFKRNYVLILQHLKPRLLPWEHRREQSEFVFDT